MQIVDIIKWEVSGKDVAYKFPSDNLRLGSYDN